MKLVFEKSSLLSGINTVMKAVPGKTTLPILECILIDAASGEITLTANDMELAIQTTVKGTILEPGCIAVARFRNFSYAALIYGGDDLTGQEWSSRSWRSRKGIRYDLVALCKKLADEL